LTIVMQAQAPPGTRRALPPRATRTPGAQAAERRGS
jgi:hypothetical protein